MAYQLGPWVERISGIHVESGSDDHYRKIRQKEILMIQRFTASNYKDYCDRLAATDKNIQKIIKTFGYPIFSPRPGGFDGLVRIILEQQVSLRSALAVYKKLKSLIDPVTPEKLIRLEESDFKSCGFSRQKTNYVKILADEILGKRLDLSVMSTLPEKVVREKLIAVKGIGNWTCDVYLLFCLNRLDIFPIGDLALVKSMVENQFIEKSPSKAEIQRVSEQYKPLRSIFAMILWHAYIVKRNIQLE